MTDRERLGRHELGQVGAVRVRDELEVERRLAAAVGRSGGRVERVVLLEEHQLDVSGARLVKGGERVWGKEVKLRWAEVGGK